MTSGNVIQDYYSDLAKTLLEDDSNLTYREFVEKCNPNFIWAPHVIKIVDAVQDWMDGKWDHLSVHICSQHGKTELGPRCAIPYILLNNPQDWCAITSYQANIAYQRAFDARSNYQKMGGELPKGAGAVAQWRTSRGGGCWSAGTAGAQTGQSASWAFIDDGDKDWLDAINATSQNRKRTWYSSTLRSRETMFAQNMREMKICQTVTRWAEDDLAGYILDKGHNAGENWGILVISALYDPRILEEYKERWPNFDILPDFRTTPGEPIWEQRRTAEDWEQVRKIRGPIIFDTECQQRPRGVEKGGQFEASWFKPLEEDPAFTGQSSNEGVYSCVVRAWDVASVEGGGDWTAGVKIGKLIDGDYVVRHTVKAQLGTQAVRQLIACTMIADGPNVIIRIPEDPGAGGKAWAEGMVNYLREVSFKANVPLPKIVVKKPMVVAHSSLPAKAARAQHFKSVSSPISKDIPGAVSYVNKEWRVGVTDKIPNFYEAVKGWPALSEIVSKATLLWEPWSYNWLREMQSFTGAHGGKDDQVDATIDAHDEISPLLPLHRTIILPNAPFY